jgi:acetyl-CoA carboxylase carboxyl transferase subunit alpha
VETRNNIYTNLTPWQRVQLARHPKRPYTLDYLRLSFEDFSELHGDRLYSDDKAMVCGFAMLGEERVMVIGTQKGRDTKENVMRNFGCAHPEGYRKALRLMKLADKFELPIITIIDTAGAFPGIGAEERHIAKAIAVNLREMMTLRVPVIAVVIGEGGSGGALGIGIADRVLVLENAYYSVISPEGCASILWKDRAAAPDAADALKITSDHLKRFGLVDEVIPEPLGGAHNDIESTASTLRKHLLNHIKSIKRMPVKKRLESRYKKFRELGQFEEEPLARNAS